MLAIAHVPRSRGCEGHREKIVMTTGAPTIARNANYFVRTVYGNGVGQLGQRVTDLGRVEVEDF
jgi:hypothetical protein